MISPGEHLQWLWGQPALQGQHGVPKYVGEGVPMCSHCQAETGGTLFSVGHGGFCHRGQFSCSQALAFGLWLVPPRLHVAGGCCLPAGLGKDLQELLRNLFSSIYFDTGWKLWKVGPVFAAVVSQNHSW